MYWVVAMVTFLTQDEKNPVLDSVKEGIVDLYAVKHLGIKLATNAACTILRVDQVGIVSLCLLRM